MTGIEDMLNAQLVAHVMDDEDATETERELADRLRASIEEIELLVADLQDLRRIVELPYGNEA